MDAIYKAIISGEGCTPIFAILILIIIGLAAYSIRLWKKVDQWENDFKDISEKYYLTTTKTATTLEHIKELIVSIQNEFFRR